MNLGLVMSINISRIKECAQVPLRLFSFLHPAKQPSKCIGLKCFFFPSGDDIEAVIVRSELFNCLGDRHRWSPDTKTYFFYLYSIISKSLRYMTSAHGYGLFTHSKFNNISHF